MRVVFDTNVYVSALVFPGGRADLQCSGFLAGSMCLSSPCHHQRSPGVLAEKFSRDCEELIA
jgi:hypothetical protein